MHFHLTQQRVELSLLTRLGYSQRSVALVLGVSPSTICRELTRNRQTLTLDNGTEMSNYETIERQTNIQVYFAQPYHSWERGTNENTNGLLRFYFPKQMGFAHLTQGELDVAVLQLNTRPRKRLGYKTPKQVFEAKW